MSTMGTGRESDANEDAFFSAPEQELAVDEEIDDLGERLAPAVLARRTRFRRIVGGILGALCLLGLAGWLRLHATKSLVRVAKSSMGSALALVAEK
jgi:hypothetical protein